MTSSIDPRNEITAIAARLSGLGPFYEGVDQGTKFAVDGFNRKVPYRDMQPGSVIPAAQGRLMAGNEQQQPHVWAFQIAHVAPTRKEAIDLSIATDLSLIGWAPTVNSGVITTFYFTVYDEFAKNGELVQWIATRFYSVTLGAAVDMSITL